MHRHTVPAALAALCAAAPLAAQPSQSVADTLPFRSGQWGLEGNVSGSSVGSGVLRFLSRSTAVVFNLSGIFSSSSQEALNAGGSTSEQENSTLGASSSLGVRRYRPLGNGVAGFATVGAVVTVVRNHGESGSQPRSESTTRNLGGGAFGDLGATLFVTPRLGLSAVYGVNVQRTRSRNSSRSPGFTSESEANGWDVGLGGVRFNASLFF